MFPKIKLTNQNSHLWLQSVTVLMTSIIVWFDTYSLRKSVEETYVSQLDGMKTAINGRYEESHNIADVQQIFDYIQYKESKRSQLTLYGKQKVLASTDRIALELPLHQNYWRLFSLMKHWFPYSQ